MITAMTLIAFIFWTIVFAAGLVALLLGILGDDPRGSRSYEPPRSHDDPFSRMGSSFR